MLYATPIRKRDFYLRGGFANSRLYRRMKSGAWRYYFRNN